METQIGCSAAPAAAMEALYPRAVDKAARPKVSKRALALQFVIGGAGGGALAAFVVSRLGKNSLVELAALFGLCIVLLWLQVLVHEAGHALAGVLRGRRLIGAGIGPMRLERGVGGWRIRWGGGIRGIGGFAAVVPANGRGDSRKDEAIFLLGGPLANLVVAAVATAVLVLAPPDGVVAPVALGATAFAGGMLGIVNLIPMTSQGWRSDGLRLREVLRDTAAWRVGRLQQRVVSLSLAGVRPRDWPLADLDVSGGVAPDLAVSAHALRLSWALDRGDAAAATASALALSNAYPTVPDGQRQGVALMLAVYAAQCARDARLLAAWRPLCEGGLLDLGAHRLWLDAEAAAMAGDAATARRLASESRAALPRVHDPASVTVLRERLDRLDARVAGEMPAFSTATVAHPLTLS